MTTNNTPIHPGGMTATQSMEFFIANGIKGQFIRRVGRSGRILCGYTCRTKYMSGLVSAFEHKILALPEHHNL